VMLGTLDVLAGDGGAATEHAAAIDGFRRAFAHRLAAAREEIAQPEAIQRCVELIETTRARVGRELPAAAAARETLEYGLSTQYRKARKAFRRARETQAAADLHEWRKQTKYLRAAQAAFGDMRGNGMAQRDRRAQRIGNWLGKDHDLAVLAELLGGRGQSTGAAGRELSARADQRRATLRSKALRKAEKLFAEKPRAYVARVMEATA